MRNAAVWQVAFSPDGRLLAVAVDPNGGGDGFYVQQRQGEVQLWDVGSRSRVGRKIVPGAGTVFAVAFIPDGTLLATGSAGRLDLWDVATQTHHGQPMRVSDDGVLSVAFDPNGRLVAGGGATGPARVWRVTDQRPAFPPLTGHTGPITGAAFDAAGSFLATTSLFGGTRLWDPRLGPRLRRRAGREHEVARTAGAVHRPSFPRAAQRVQPGRHAAGRRWGRDARDAVGRRSGALAHTARARSSGGT